MTNEDRATLAALVAEMCRQQLAASGEPFEIVLVDSPEGDSPATVASVGLAHPDIKGALALVAPQSFFRATYPAELARERVTDEDLADWAGELVNQLLGRLKNRLGALGVDFSIGAPIVVRGDRLHVRFKDGPTCVGCKLRIRGERMDIFFDVSRDNGGALLVPGTGTPTSASAEGDALLF